MEFPTELPQRRQDTSKASRGRQNTRQAEMSWLHPKITDSERQGTQAEAYPLTEMGFPTGREIGQGTRQGPMGQPPNEGQGDNREGQPSFSDRLTQGFLKAFPCCRGCLSSSEGNRPDSVSQGESLDPNTQTAAFPLTTISPRIGSNEASNPVPENVASSNTFPQIRISEAGGPKSSSEEGRIFEEEITSEAKENPTELHWYEEHFTSLEVRRPRSSSHGSSSEGVGSGWGGPFSEGVQRDSFSEGAGSWRGGPFDATHLSPPPSPQHSPKRRRFSLEPDDTMPHPGQRGFSDTTRRRNPSVSSRISVSSHRSGREITGSIQRIWRDYERAKFTDHDEPEWYRGQPLEIARLVTNFTEACLKLDKEVGEAKDNAWLQMARKDPKENVLEENDKNTINDFYDLKGELDRLKKKKASLVSQDTYEKLGIDIYFAESRLESLEKRFGSIKEKYQAEIDNTVEGSEEIHKLQEGRSTHLRALQENATTLREEIGSPDLVNSAINKHLLEEWSRVVRTVLEPKSPTHVDTPLPSSSEHPMRPALNPKSSTQALLWTSLEEQSSPDDKIRHAVMQHLALMACYDAASDHQKDRILQALAANVRTIGNIQEPVQAKD